MLLEKQVTINGTVDLNQFKLTGFEDEYELNVLFPRVDVGELQYTNVVLILRLIQLKYTSRANIR